MNNLSSIYQPQISSQNKTRRFSTYYVTIRISPRRENGVGIVVIVMRTVAYMLVVYGWFKLVIPYLYIYVLSVFTHSLIL